MANNRLSKENVLHITEKFFDLTGNLKEEQAVKRIQPILTQYRLGLFRIVTVGEIKKGKSSFIGALLGEPELLPATSDVTTSTVFKIMYGESKKYKVFFYPEDVNNPDNTTPPAQEITREQLAEYGTEDGNSNNKKRVDFIGVQVPNPLLKSGVVLIDTPGLGGLFKEHSDIAWRYIPNADAIFFVLDSVEAVASKAEMDCLQKLSTMTPYLFFVQTKIDLVKPDQWQKWRERNLKVVAETLKVPMEKLIYFPVSSMLKNIADKEHSPCDLNESGFIPLIHFLHNKLLRIKEEKLANALLKSVANEVSNIRRKLGDDLQIHNAKTKEELDVLEREFTETKTRFEKWQAKEYQQLVSTFRNESGDTKRETLESLQNELEPSVNGPIIRPMIEQLRQGIIDAKKLNQEAGAIQSACIDRCNQQIFTIQGQYNQKMKELTHAFLKKLGQSYSDEIESTVRGVSISTVKTLYMHFSEFENWRNLLYGGMAGGAIGSVVAFVAGIIIPPLGVAAFIAQFVGTVGGGVYAKRDLNARRAEEAISKLQGILSDTVRLAQKQAIQQFQSAAIEFDRVVNDTFEKAAAETSKELQGKLVSITEARKSAREENINKATHITEILKQSNNLLQDIGQITGAVNKTIP